MDDVPWLRPDYQIERFKPDAERARLGVIAWAQPRQTNGFLEAINGLFQAAKRKARGYGRFGIVRITAKRRHWAKKSNDYAALSSRHSARAAARFSLKFSRLQRWRS